MKRENSILDSLTNYVIPSCNFLEHCNSCSKAHTNDASIILHLLHFQILHVSNFKKLKDRILTETMKGATPQHLLDSHCLLQFASSSKTDTPSCR